MAKSLQNIEAKDIRRAAMDLLARREHSFKELEDKLFIRFQKAVKRAQSNAQAKKAEKISIRALEAAEIDLETVEIEQEQGQSESEIQALIHEQVERLRTEALQSDARLAEAYLRARSNRGHGPIKIAVELRQKGVSDQLIDSAFAESDIDWAVKVREVSTKKFGDEKLDLKLCAKRDRFLMQRGFPFDLIALVDS